jgi:hypothetical protein
MGGFLCGFRFGGILASGACSVVFLNRVGLALAYQLFRTRLSFRACTEAFPIQNRYMCPANMVMDFFRLVVHGPHDPHSSNERGFGAGMERNMRGGY